MYNENLKAELHLSILKGKLAKQTILKKFSEDAREKFALLIAMNVAQHFSDHYDINILINGLVIMLQKYHDPVELEITLLDTESKNNHLFYSDLYKMCNSNFQLLYDKLLSYIDSHKSEYTTTKAVGSTMAAAFLPQALGVAAVTGVAFRYASQDTDITRYRQYSFARKFVMEITSQLSATGHNQCTESQIYEGLKTIKGLFVSCYDFKAMEAYYFSSPESFISISVQSIIENTELKTYPAYAIISQSLAQPLKGLHGGTFGKDNDFKEAITDAVALSFTKIVGNNTQLEEIEQANQDLMSVISGYNSRAEFASAIGRAENSCFMHIAPQDTISPFVKDAFYGQSYSFITME